MEVQVGRPASLLWTFCTAIIPVEAYQVSTGPENFMQASKARQNHLGGRVALTEGFTVTGAPGWLSWVKISGQPQCQEACA
jgi:hypothetical protein